MKSMNQVKTYEDMLATPLHHYIAIDEDTGFTRVPGGFIYILHIGTSEARAVFVPEKEDPK